MAAAGGPYDQHVMNELWLELRYMVQWINTGQVGCVDLYWALEIIRILDNSTGFHRGHYNYCRTKIITTAHQYNIVPMFRVNSFVFLFKRFSTFKCMQFTKKVITNNLVLTVKTMKWIHI